MASPDFYSHSPQLPHNSLQHAYALDPATPVHSPHHSIHSSTSSRTPIHTLSIHEYRKQQNTPTSQASTPSGKTLRRKPAAPALNGVERVQSIARAPLRSLHFSQSAQQLTTHQPLPRSPPHLFPQQPLSDHAFRTQSAEPRIPGGIGPRYQSTGHVDHGPSLRSNNPAKVSNFKPIKRLPKPSTKGSAQSPLHSPPAIVTSVRSRLSPLQTTSYSNPETQFSSDTQTTPSTFSLSRFPQPPHAFNPSLSPPIDENAPPPPYLSTTYTTTAPATPPATPAVIHYRGASFDLVNPHESLLFHDIVTPSRDLDSTDYPLLSTPDDSDIMAPKRNLYGDLTSAYSSITRRTEDSPNLNLPLPPTPAAVSPGFSDYSSPTFSYESNLAVSPLAVRKVTADETRFSLKQLTRSLTKKLVRDPEPGPTELRDFSIPIVTAADVNGPFPRPLLESYRHMGPITHDHSAFRMASPVSPMSPMSPLSRTFPTADTQRSSKHESDVSVERPRFVKDQSDTSPLSSMIPDDPSTQVARGDSPHPMSSHPRISFSESDIPGRPYYEDMTSLYPGSSIYSHEGDDTSAYPPSLYSKRKSNPFAPLSLENPFTGDYSRDSLYSYVHSNHASRRASRPLTLNDHRLSKPMGNEKTDTISKLIDHYGLNDNTDSHPIADSNNYDEPTPVQRPRRPDLVPGFSQFDFDLPHHVDAHQSGHQNDVPDIHPFQPSRGRKAVIMQAVGSPPRTQAPLAPAFEYDEEPKPIIRQETSDIYSAASSYGDTCHLLQTSPPRAEKLAGLVPPVSRPLLEPSSSYSQGSGQINPLLGPSSSYSQPDGCASPSTPQVALDEAEKIFGEAASGSKDGGIPAMWSGRGSGNLLRSNRDSGVSANMTDGEEEKGDWETVGSGGHKAQHSLGDSIADYSSTDSSRVSFSKSGLLPIMQQQHSSLYSYPSPLPSHDHPFSSSPPMDTRVSLQAAPYDGASSQVDSSPPPSSTVPLFRTRKSNSNHGQPYHFTPWTTAPQFTLSDKETQELLNSGPNDEILYEDQQELADPISNMSFQEESPGLVRENSFEKFSFLGPRGNLTGTPLGTNMQEVGSSVADNSSPGAALSSSPYTRLRRPRSGYPGFYVAPGRTVSVTRIRTSQGPLVASPATPPELDRSPSEVTLFPERLHLPPPAEPTPLLAGRRKSINSPMSPSRRASRAAVNGQTKLRDMILASDTQIVNLSQAGRKSHYVPGHCVRPSTANTDTPLRPTLSEVSLKPNLANEHSPHLLCPERALDPQVEEERRRTSWIIFALFCVLPPMLVLYRWLGDYTIIALTKGRLGHCTQKPKRIALGVGIAVNISLVSVILIPILVAHAAGLV
ncbi:hypothetical protein K504DRAFT_472885 [Pleomassaria siparia CBS 279.74]|uniref:Uncharacterized protein n=1 Tax=Pleomassaria siparia CBS 279.74 TaxID=1314801 RepID=A0A6G1KL64_9PLEO|nr:hypothetical protein K504DRAFT_472885 [Pleomassaria siparia CBS 279.74]